VAERVVLFSIPQLRRRDVTPGSLSSLDRLSGHGQVCDLEPVFPGVTASAFATLVTGVGPYRHGIVGDVYFDRATRQVVRPPLPETANLAPRVWDTLKELRPSARTLLWFGPNSEASTADYKAGLDAQGRPFFDPSELEDELAARFGPYPSSGAGTSDAVLKFETTAWILRTGAHLAETMKPDLAVIRAAHLGHVARRFGPDSREMSRAIPELDRALGPVLAALQRDALVLAVTETIATTVSDPVDINLSLRALGLIGLHECGGGGFDIDVGKSAAFGLVDQQICHVYVSDRDRLSEITAALSVGVHADGISVVASGGQLARLGLDHGRSGDIVLVSDADRWFRGDWWRASEPAPHAGSGLSGLHPSVIQSVSDPARVKGALGTATPIVEDRGVLLANRPLAGDDAAQVAMHEIAPLILDALEQD
jgi:hypothetical protein